MALDNSGWGYTRIQGALANLGHKVGRGTVAIVLNPSCSDYGMILTGPCRSHVL